MSHVASYNFFLSCINLFFLGSTDALFTSVFFVACVIMTNSPQHVQTHPVFYQLHLLGNLFLPEPLTYFSLVPLFLRLLPIFFFLISGLISPSLVVSIGCKSSSYKGETYCSENYPTSLTLVIEASLSCSDLLVQILSPQQFTIYRVYRDFCSSASNFLKRSMLTT